LAVIKNIQIEMAFPMERYSINLKHIGKSNLLQARNLAIEIEIDVAIGTFDTTLRKYKSKVDGKLHEQKAFVDIFVDWTKMYRNRDCEINVDYHATRNMLRRWGNFGVNGQQSAISASVNGKFANLINQALICQDFFFPLSFFSHV
jgi:hypothetical protein